MKKPNRQNTCTMNSTQFELFNKLFQRLVRDDVKSEMELYTLSVMSNTKKMHLLLTEVDRITDDRMEIK